VAVLPLIKKEPLLGIADKLVTELRKKYFVEYDESGSIGRRYRRQDEIGTPFCITVDFDGAEAAEKSVTVRHRDSMEQERIALDDIDSWLAERLG
jgi:glycyl-tRNA synthetase